jgi:hypothetical protein
LSLPNDDQPVLGLLDAPCFFTNLKLSVLIIHLGVEPDFAPQEKTTFILVGPSLFLLSLPNDDQPVLGLLGAPPPAQPMLLAHACAHTHR